MLAVMITLAIAILVALGFVFAQVLSIRSAQRREDNEQLIAAGIMAPGAMKRLDQTEEEQELKGYAKKLHQADIKQSFTTWILLQVAIIVVLMLFFGVVARSLLFSIAPLFVVPIIFHLMVNSRIKKRKRMFEQQFGRACNQIAGSIRTGMSIDRAVRSVAAYMDDPLREEFQIVAAECAFDPDVAAALKRMAIRMESSDAMLFASMIELNQRRGGKLADSVERLSETISTRQAMRRHVQSESSNGKITARAILVLTLLIVAFMVFSNETYLNFYLTNVFGYIAIAVAAVFFIVGTIIMSQLTEFDME